MNIKNWPGLALVVAAFIASGSAGAANIQQNNLVIQKVRAVGNYEGTTYDNTVEVWFATPLTWPAGSQCTNTNRVYVDASHQHLVAAAYFALNSGLSVSVNVDESLPIRSGACEVSFIDVVKP